jgi:two-component system chemotaxis response regulator CheY
MMCVYREMLVTMNHRLVAEARDGEEAVGTYRKLGFHPDIVLMDYRMPRMNGIDAMREIRRINPEQCIIFVTSDPDAAGEARRMGANTFALKPFRLDRLSETINTVLSSRQRKEDACP